MGFFNNVGVDHDVILRKIAIEAVEDMYDKITYGVNSYVKLTSVPERLSDQTVHIIAILNNIVINIMREIRASARGDGSGFAKANAISMFDGMLYAFELGEELGFEVYWQEPGSISYKVLMMSIKI